MNFSRLGSLSSRLCLSSLAILLLAIWTLAFFVSRTMQEDMRLALNGQQSSTVAVLAAEIEKEIVFRLNSLQQVAAQISPAMLDDPTRLQAYLESQVGIKLIFNFGALVIDANGTAGAALPSTPGRLRANYSDRDYFVGAMNDKTTISKPLIGKLSQAPLFVMAQPIRNGQGKVIGVIAGVTDLTQANFLDSIAAHTYGKNGGYVLIAPQHQLIVTASDKRLVMSKANGSDPLVKRFMQGYQGSGVLLDTFGVETLASAKAIPAAGWLLMVGLPTAEAFAPIVVMQRRTLLATVLLSLFAAGLIFWLIRRQLWPMLEATRTLAQLSTDAEFPHALPVAESDEVGALIGGFNHLLQTLAHREETLRLSEENLAITLHSIGDAVIATDANGSVTQMNPTAERLTGWNLAQAYGRPLPEVFKIINADTREICRNPVELVMTRGEIVGLANHTVLLAQDGAQYQISDSAAPIRDAGGRISGVVLVFSDVSKRYLTEEALRRAEEQFRNIFKLMPNSLTLQNKEGVVLDCSDAFCELTGYSREEIIGTNMQSLGLWVHPEDRQSMRESLERNGMVDALEFQLRRHDGEIRIMQISAKYLVHENEPILLAVAHDITARKLAEDALRTNEHDLQIALKEKTSLLNEVHHRVKNNLQVITSLLRLEEGRSDQANTKIVLSEMQGRIRSMALLHETLYRSGIFASADLADYLGELATQAFRAQASGGAVIGLKLDLDKAMVSMDQATPCGLMVNELISNCLKHGFPDGRTGEVVISLKIDESANQVQLRVSDNGIGLPPDFEAKREASLGLQMASDLARQIGGSLEIGPGSAFRVAFPIGDYEN